MGSLPGSARSSHPGALVRWGRGMKPRLLDLFSGAGGSAKGYMDAGFTVLGVDHRSQPYYVGDEGVMVMDVRDLPRFGNLPPIAAIHASPPCQKFSRLRNMSKRDHEDLIPWTREFCQRSGLPYVIENVPEAPLIDSFLLCGTMFGLKVRRHRIFESNVFMWPEADACQRSGVKNGIYHSFLSEGGPLGNRAEYRDAMGCDWMSVDASRQAIPPAYTKWIGKQLLRALPEIRMEP